MIKQTKKKQEIKKNNNKNQKKGKKEQVRRCMLTDMKIRDPPWENKITKKKTKTREHRKTYEVTDPVSLTSPLKWPRALCYQQVEAKHLILSPKNLLIHRILLIDTRITFWLYTPKCSIDGLLPKNLASLPLPKPTKLVV